MDNRGICLLDSNIFLLFYFFPSFFNYQMRVDRALLDPLHRLPLGPFEDSSIPVIVETLDLHIPTFNESKSVPEDHKPQAPPSASTAKPPAPAAPAAPKITDPAPSGNKAPVKEPAPPPPPAPAPPKPPTPPPAPPKPLPNLTSTIIEMDTRLRHTKAQCQRFKLSHSVDSFMYLLPKYNITYCKVPKAGNIYWEQIFSFLNKDSRELQYLDIKSPFQISKYDIRYTSHFNLPRHSWRVEEDVKATSKTKRIIFVRHPLERLWASYIEKFFLIDYWATMGLEMKTTGAANKCPKTITFREFIDYTLPIFDEHWTPMHELCNPCVYDPTYLGKVETFREDSYRVLTEAKLQWIFNEHDKISRQESHMLDMTIFNYQIHGMRWYKFFYRCFSQKDLAVRLWEVFRKIGYLSSHAALPTNLPDYNQTTIIKELKYQLKKYPLDSKNGRLQQLKSIRKDYEGLPKTVMAKILEKYALDFEIFGYSTDLPTV